MWMERPLVSQIRLIALVAYITNEIRPGDAVSGLDQPWMGYGTERFAYITCVGNIAVGREEDGA